MLIFGTAQIKVAMLTQQSAGKVTKVLIANRGAIATRIIRTLKKMQLGSVAIYAESDADSLHVRHANESYCLGEGAASDTYLDMDKIIAIAKKTGAQAIHPGYGFLSENASFVKRCEQEGLIFIGPTLEQMTTFGLKHTARRLAEQANVPLSPGTDLLNSLDEALESTKVIGFPVMLKSTAGGGGIGMQLCHSIDDVASYFETVKRLGASNFADDGVFIEKFIENARHIEVQMFGDGQGNVLAIGERDCSAQRRNQKVIEECPAPNLTDEIRQDLYQTAERLLASINYRNAGTVEFIYDTDSQEFYFLEVNTRLQVEHGVTEEVYGIDLVEWMVLLAAGAAPDLNENRQTLSPQGHAIQVRIYAEDPYLNFQPSAGLLTQVDFPQGQKGIRIDHWIESGITVPPFFDPMLAKVIIHADDRPLALVKLQNTLDDIRLYGSETNLNYLQTLTRDNTLAQGLVTTRYLNNFDYLPARIDVLQGGTQTTIQDYPARAGYWHVGVPPSGPFDNVSFRLANQLLGNDPLVAGLEITLQGPVLKFSKATRIAITGAAIDARLDDVAIAMFETVTVNAGQTLHLGRIQDTGMRSYLCVQGGIQSPEYLGSRSTFTLGKFGGHDGRSIRTGDVLHISNLQQNVQQTDAISEVSKTSAKPLPIQNTWQLKVVYGPHGAPDFFTDNDIETFFNHQWEVHYNSNRTGVRLIGPKPEWARKDGGEAGLHPSNIHDNAYAFGSVDFTGDMPVILGPDGPSLGGFVCPLTVIHADLWKLGQLRSGDKIQFIPVSLETAAALESVQNKAVEALDIPLINSTQISSAEISSSDIGMVDKLTTESLISPILDTFSDASRADTTAVDIVFRAAGDHFLLVEYGAMELDIELRFRAHALMQWLQENTLEGIRELTPGIRSLQIHYDSQRISHSTIIAHIKTGETYLSTQLSELKVPSRIVRIPLSWDDEACQKAIQVYDETVRKDAPWCPSNLEFIRRINGLDSIDKLKEIVFDASYLVMGLGDVYLGAPVATPVDPRHRLVTTKYNPARTWTAENSVGIGGSYLCVYGMEGPGGYQFIGRTLQMWNRYKQTAEFEKPWLLRFFDQIQFYEVSQDELKDIRKKFPAGLYPLKIRQTHFCLADYREYLAQHSTDIQAFNKQRDAAFNQELENWHATNQFNYELEESVAAPEQEQWPEDSTVISSPLAGSIWKTHISIGQTVKAGDTLITLASMKMEVPVTTLSDGVVTHIVLAEGKQVNAGQALVILADE